MATKAANNKKFYLKAFLISFSIISIVYSFMIFQFWWGNHDWEFLKDGILLKDGFFEARYAQHLPNILFLNGQILPPIMFITIFALLALLSLLIAKYLQVPQKIPYYILFTLILTIQSHTPILFYYVFISLPLIFWGCFGTSLLFLSQRPYKLWKFILGSLGFFLLLGSYPPILTLPLTLFIAQRIQKYISSKEDLKEIIYKSLFYLSQLFSADILYKLTISYLTKIGTVNTLMYNTAVKNTKDIFLSLFTEPLTYFTRISELYQTLGISYISLLYIPLIIAIVVIFHRAKNKLLAFLLICALIVASRFAFILSDNANFAFFRISWWGQTALIAFGISVILQINKVWLKNITFAYLTFLLFIFARTDFTIQKTQFLAFQSERLFQKRVEERLFSLPDFDINKEYATLNLGYPDFHHHFCIPDCSGFDNELLSHTVMPADFGSAIFWDETKNPTVLRYGYWSQRLWIVHGKHSTNKIFSYTKEEMAKLRQWMYFSAQKYPHKEAIYLNNSLLLFYFDSIFFNKNKEDVFRNLKNYK